MLFICKGYEYVLYVIYMKFKGAGNEYVVYVIYIRKFEYIEEKY